MDPDCECMACGHEWHSSESEECPKCGWAGQFCVCCKEALTPDNSDDVHGDHCDDCECDRCGGPLYNFSYGSDDFCDECMELLHANDY